MFTKLFELFRTNRSVRIMTTSVSVFTLAVVLTWGLTRGESRVIQTVAGTGAQGYSGDGGMALEARLNTPQGVSVDAAGNLYFADVGNSAVRRVDTAGRITTLAGLGPDKIGYDGDNQPANKAKLNAAADVKVDADGNVYIADNGNHRVRRVDPTGRIATIAGTGDPGFSGDGGPARLAQVRNPSGLALDAAGNLYIADAGNFKIRRIDKVTGVISTVAGSGYGSAGDGGPATSAQFKGPVAVAIGPAGDLYIADSSAHRIRRVSSDGIITTVAGNGTFNVFSKEELGDDGLATDAVVRFPFGVAFDSLGNLYIAENGSSRIRKVDTRGIITTVAGSGDPRTRGFGGDGGSATDALLNGPSGVFVDATGNLYISDSSNSRIRRVNAQ